MKLGGLIKKISRLFYTVSFLKRQQIIYQLKYRIKKVKSLAPFIPVTPVQVSFLKFSFNVPQQKIVEGDKSFTFLNLEHKFVNDINWDEQRYGKLWNYNLQYFDFLRQQDISDNTKLLWLREIGDWLVSGRLKPEPYPVSLRVINTIRFLSGIQHHDEDLTRQLYAQVNYLDARLEYHLLGNHLLENGFALIAGGCFFKKAGWEQKAKQLLTDQLNEQILDDGAHFELSPMYHQIILFRMLELLDWYQSVENADAAFISFIIQKTVKMLGWLKTITFNNGDIPHFNDSATGIAFTSAQLFGFAAHLGLTVEAEATLGSSGYRNYRNNNYECVVDVGPVGPSYQPGHSHADALSFILYANNTPFIVDAGTSTYQIGERRDYERSTHAHNTVEVNCANQSDVWGGFRVGRRADVTVTEQTGNRLCAAQNGYKRSFGILHNRCFDFNDNSIIITDFTSPVNNNLKCRALFHFNPSINVKFVDANKLEAGDGMAVLTLNGAKNIQLQNYQLAQAYNLYAEATLLTVEFDAQLETIIDFKL
ncbi:hypothetical protein CKK33_07860 [Mucilaginibacter sp. MD40]|uniref:heparinase II/III family protein n=1 Tax=Mucilaginibacter sp. MD40 TaxID=2029590 RepID=UPI000BACD4F5|nr:heparinase II/III family protein [Mucilaginibacter sp. MD40]PAW93408.1 hypothetical protein CKK33_07860 [Mucilaginibacter sp. MD40]